MQVVLSLNPGGTERLVLALVRRLRTRFSMTVCCLEEPGLWAADLHAEGIAVHALRRTPGLHPALGKRIRDIARQVGAGVLHCHQYSPFVYGCLARALSPRLSIVFTEHGRLSDAPPSAKRRLVNPLISRFADRILSVSHDLRRHMVAEGLPASRVEVVHNGVDVEPPANRARDELRAELSLPAGAIAIVTVARLDPVKHLGAALEALTILRRLHNVVLVIVGGGSEHEALRAQAIQLGVDDAVRWLGHRDDARAWLGGCDIYVNTSISEGISLTILEGMAAGLPAVVTAVGGTPEIVDSTCGVLVPARDAAALADAIRPLATDSALRERLGRAARERVLSQFTLDRMVDSYARMYEELSH